jgi:hypothetical protein
MKKKLHEAEVANELRGASLFFQKSPPLAEEEKAKPTTRRHTANAKKMAPAPASISAPETAPVADPDQLVEQIHHAVRRLGKEATFCRLTVAEKTALGEIVYHYKRNGVRTSENEVIRIAVNWLIENHRAEGPKSVLAQVLDQVNL